MFIFLDFLYLVVFIVYLPVLVLRGRWHNQFLGRLGLDPKSNQAAWPSGVIWIHAVSVGEVLAVADLIKKIRLVYAHSPIVCSTVTKTGYEVAQKTLEAAQVIYAPVDFSWAVKAYIRILKPVIYIAAETELWPNLFHFLNQKNIPIVLVNGRISDKAYRGYHRIKWALRHTLGCVSYFCMQSSQDKERITALGAAPEKAGIVGNIKFDQLPAVENKSQSQNVKDILVLTAGSTHPGEEEILLGIYQDLKKEFSSLRLILVPRHVERAQEVSRLVETFGLKAAVYNGQGEIFENAGAVVVVGQVGLLRSIYPFSDIVFIGKTMTVGGGQNMIEPAALGKPVVVGARTQNFKDVMQLFLQAQAILQVHDKERLSEEIHQLLKNPSKRKEIGQKALKVVQDNRGATQKTLAVIAQFLPAQT